jgi:hypothetical protein
MSLKVVGLRVDGADKDAVHARLAGLLRERVPALRWVSSYRTRGGTFDFVDVFEADDEDEDDDDVEQARAALDEVDGLRYEWMDAEASALLRAPGGGAPGGG